MTGERKTDRRSRYTKKAITDAYLSLLAEKPKSKIRVTQICDLAEINRCTFYLHFEDINAVEKAIQEELLEKFRHFVQTQRKTTKDRLQLSSLFMEQILQDPTYRILMKTEQETPSFLSAMQQFFEVDLMESLPPKSSLTERQKKLLYQFVAGGTMAVHQKWLREGCENVREENAFLDLLVHSVMSGGFPPTC